MKLVSRTTQIDDKTYEPIHHITLEFAAHAIEQMVTHRSINEAFCRITGDMQPTGIDWKKEFEDVMGRRLMEILEEEFRADKRPA